MTHPRRGAKLLRPGDADEPDEVLQGVLVGPTRVKALPKLANHSASAGTAARPWKAAAVRARPDSNGTIASAVIDTHARGFPCRAEAQNHRASHQALIVGARRP